MDIHKKKIKTNNSNNTLLVIFVSAIILIIVVIFVLLNHKTIPDTSTSEGMAFLEAEEAKDPEVAEKTRYIQELDKSFEGMDVWQKLNAIQISFVGDSRVAMFINMEELNSSYVLADKSTTIRDIPDYIPYMQELWPNFIMLSFGMNDMGMYQFDPEHYWENGKEYVGEYKEYTDQIQDACPDSQICICAILPATEEGIERQSRWAFVDEWNECLKEFCDENGFIYIDAATTAYEHPDMYDNDGVHFTLNFYPYWAETIWEAVEPWL